MSIARSAVHRDVHAADSWLPIATARVTARAAVSGRHRRAGSRLEDDGTAALVRRAAGASAVWLVAFGLFSLAEGWTLAGALALSLGVLVAFGVAASIFVATAPAVDDPMVAHRRRVNLRRNRYGSMT